MAMTHVTDETFMEYMNSKLYPGDLIYHFSWGVNGPFEIKHFSVSGTREEIVELMQFLANDEDVVEPNLSISSPFKKMVTKHVHMKDGVRQEHDWGECPENPRSQNYNPE